jgi:hypothetical protein
LHNNCSDFYRSSWIMLKSITIFLFFVGLLACAGCWFEGLSSKNASIALVAEDTNDVKIAGLSFVAPPRPFSDNPMTAIKAIQSNWIAVIPYAFTILGKPVVHYRAEGGQWWGERPEGVRKSIQMAHDAGLKVMLKPQVYIPNGWTGGLTFSDSLEWKKWEASYTDYLMQMVTIATELEVEMLCIGTEFSISTKDRPQYWTNLIKAIKLKYPGKLTYSANWDNYESVSFWPDLDFIGISAYFSISEGTTPKTEDLLVGWKSHAKKLQAVSATMKKPILFTEYGYLSVDGCAWKGWEVESKVNQMPVNQQAQANAIGALWNTFSQEPWWAGGFLWKWFPEMQGHEGYPERDYTPQGKIAQDTLKYWHQKTQLLLQK